MTGHPFGKCDYPAVRGTTTVYLIFHLFQGKTVSQYVYFLPLTSNHNHPEQKQANVQTAAVHRAAEQVTGLQVRRSGLNLKASGLQETLALNAGG